jgi:hypothetical protein
MVDASEGLALELEPFTRLKPLTVVA